MPVPLTYSMPGATVITLGERPRARFSRGEPHVHPCPRCHELGECVQECDYEPDLSEDPGMLSGCHALCDECESEPFGPRRGEPLLEGETCGTCSSFGMCKRVGLTLGPDETVCAYRPLHWTPKLRRDESDDEWFGRCEEAFEQGCSQNRTWREYGPRPKGNTRG